MKGLLANHTVGLQLLLPGDWTVDPVIASRMKLLADCGFTGVELNILEPERVNPAALRDWLGGFGLRMTAFASGATAKAFNLSLSHADETLRRLSVGRCRQFLEFAGAMGGSVIVGFMKGGPGATREPLLRSLRELAPMAEGLGVTLIVEATNRYECGVCNSVEQTLSVLDEVGSPGLRMLPDTFHMNIEERDQLAALDSCNGRFVSVHLSDNNRLLPGLGGIDFGRIVRHLVGGGYKGIFALEGNTPDFEAAVKAARDCLESLS